MTATFKTSMCLPSLQNLDPFILYLHVCVLCVLSLLRKGPDRVCPLEWIGETAGVFLGSFWRGLPKVCRELLSTRCTAQPLLSTTAGCDNRVVTGQPGTMRGLLHQCAVSKQMATPSWRTVP